MFVVFFFNPVALRIAKLFGVLAVLSAIKLNPCNETPFKLTNFRSLAAVCSGLGGTCEKALDFCNRREGDKVFPRSPFVILLCQMIGSA